MLNDSDYENCINIIKIVIDEINACEDKTMVSFHIISNLLVTTLKANNMKKDDINQIFDYLKLDVLESMRWNKTND